MKRTLIAGAAFASLLAVTSASAADMPIYPKAAPVAVYDWTGFYLGTNVGYSWGRGSTDGTSTASQRVSTFLTGPPTGPLLTDVVTPLAGGVFSGRSDINGFIGGGQLGYNWQIGSWLAGLEADAQASGERGRVGLVPTGVAPAFAADYSLDWFGTVRGRLGFLAAERLLVYATGGVAFGGFSGGSPTLAYAFASTKVGWTVGAGVEAALGSNWSVKFEYLYMDLGNVGSISAATAAPSVSVAVVGAAPAQTRLTQTTYSYLFNTKFTDSIARVGLNYKFGGPAAVVARY
jgi:outer membrane immunogenic protein